MPNEALVLGFCKQRGHMPTIENQSGVAYTKIAMFYLTLPLMFLKFWYLEAPMGILGFFGSLNSAFLQLFSLPLLVRTYFKPWKSEYRKGLVGFSIGMGIFIKSLVIIADIVLLLFLLSFELVFIVAFVFWPIGAFILLI